LLASLIRQKYGPLGLALVLHAAIGALFVVGFSWSGPPPAMPAQVTVKAKLVDESQILAEMQQLEQQKRAEERKIREDADRARREAAEEQQRLEKVKQEREVAERQELERQERIKEERVQQARQEKERREVDARAAQERREKEDQEKARLAEIERQRKAEEARLERVKEEQRMVAEKRRKEEEARAQAQREQELRESMALEEQRMMAENAGLLAQYKALIQQRVMRNWNRPPDAEAGINCEVFADQIPGGQVVGVRIGECNGSDAVRRSIEAAVYKASPLPEPPDPSLFERKLVFDFIPE
jgi:colicin import membrane protein